MSERQKQNIIGVQILINTILRLLLLANDEKTNTPIIKGVNLTEIKYCLFWENNNCKND